MIVPFPIFLVQNSTLYQPVNIPKEKKGYTCKSQGAATYRTHRQYDASVHESLTIMISSECTSTSSFLFCCQVIILIDTRHIVHSLLFINGGWWMDNNLLLFVRFSDTPPHLFSILRYSINTVQYINYCTWSENNDNQPQLVSKLFFFFQTFLIFWYGILK
jgi:hypothetical protein